MKHPLCPTCGSVMKRNGKSKTGSQRWRCTSCGSSKTHSNDTSARNLSSFVCWLLSKDAQIDMPGQGRTFRRKTAKFWEIWPMPEIVDEVHRVVYVDGIWLGRDAVILIACSDDYVLSWHLARSETSFAWRSLLSRIAPPEMVVTDGGSGFAKAVRAEWPTTKVQRCTFHAFNQVKKYTTTRPKLQAGVELYSLACDLVVIKDLREAELWVERFFNWCDFWNDFLNEKSTIEGRKVFTHERLRKARRSLVKLINDGTLFTYLDPVLCVEEPMPATNNRIEGGINAQLRSLLRNHRGLTLLRRIKAVFWWCYMHTECPKSMAEIIREMPTDKDIDLLEKTYGIKTEEIGTPKKWGTGIVWEEFHTQTRNPNFIRY